MLTAPPIPRGQALSRLPTPISWRLRETWGAGWAGRVTGSWDRWTHSTPLTKTCPPDPQPVCPGHAPASSRPRLPAGQAQGPARLSPHLCGPQTAREDAHFSCFPRQVTKVHEPPREDTVPPKPAPPPPQHLQPEGSTAQQCSSPRGKSRSPAPPAEKEGEHGSGARGGAGACMAGATLQMRGWGWPRRRRQQARRE